MTKIEEAKDVLSRAQDQLIGEIAACGRSGGVGRAQSYAPVLVSVSNAMNIVQAIIDQNTTPQEVVDRMAALRAAKSAKKQAE